MSESATTAQESIQPDSLLDDDPGPLEEPAGAWFVNRKNELDIFWKWANNIPGAGRNSLALSIVIRQRVGA